MPQLMLPLFPEGSTPITPDLAFERRRDTVTYFHGVLPVFQHKLSDTRSFQMIVSQFYCNGHARQVDIVRAFGVNARSVKRWVKMFQGAGVEGFYALRPHRGAAVLTASVLAEAQGLLDSGLDAGGVARKLGIKQNTMNKAVRAGRLHVGKGANATNCSEGESTLTSKSERSAGDGAAAMGMGATNVGDRMAASISLTGPAQIDFQSSLDVPNAGVLLALPALLAVGLLRNNSKHFSLPAGYYGIDTIFLLIAFMALARLKTVESLRYCAPGEWGKLMGLDRIPEVRTLRNKLSLLTGAGTVANWSAELCKDWMNAHPESAGAFYVDGHVRVYHGDKANLPRHYVARERLCLHASADYWINALGGQPFFVLHQDVDPGLIKVLKEQIVPRLLEDVPNQPTPEQILENPYLNRFTIVFDREGYSPQLFADLNALHIACLTYNKSPGEDWAESEFLPRTVTLVSGERVDMQLAERGVVLGGVVWVREIRKLTEDRHQVSIVATDYTSATEDLAVAMFARWCQENFFRYMRQHFNLDRVLSYESEAIPDTTKVINPEYRRLEGDIRKGAGQLMRKRAQIQAFDLSRVTDPQRVLELQGQHGELLEEVAKLEQAIASSKEKRKGTKKHITAGDLPEKERINRLGRDSKHFIDTIKMVAYRAESAMAQVLREKMSRHDDTRELLRGLYANEADILPDEANKTLTVRLHHQANHSNDEAIKHLCSELTLTETLYPGTDLKLVYQLGTSQNP